MAFSFLDNLWNQQNSPGKFLGDVKKEQMNNSIFVAIEML